MKTHKTERKNVTFMKSRNKRQSEEAQPVLQQRGHEIQPFNKVIYLPVGLDERVRLQNVKTLNQILADSISLRDMYKKHHWQVSGNTFYPTHLLFDKHAEEQTKLIDEIAERIQLLGGISLAMAADVAEMTKVDRPPKGRESVLVQIERLLEAHETILDECREAAEECEENGDQGTNDLVCSHLIPKHELQVWFLAEHLVQTPEVSTNTSYSIK